MQDVASNFLVQSNKVSVMPHNLFYNITLIDDSNKDRDHFSSHTSLNT